jgi:Flp pilus assembly protein TadD
MGTAQYTENNLEVSVALHITCAVDRNSMKSGIRMRGASGRSLQLSVEEVLEEASRHQSAGEYASALPLLEKAIRAAPLNPRVRHLLGECQAKTGSFPEAVYNLRKAVDSDPHNCNYRASLAQALMPLNPSEAIPHFLAAILAGSTDPEVFSNLTLILLSQRLEEDVLKVCDLGLMACREHFALLGNRAVALRHLGRQQEALACCRRQQELQPNDARVWSNMGCILREVDRLPEAEEALREACRLDPHDAGAHYNLAQVLLLTGKYLEGFREYEWRWQTPGLKDHRRTFGQPLWDGAPLSGKRILLTAEQGAGDVIQFARYVPLVAQLGGRIVMEAPPSLVRLLTFLSDRHDVIPIGSPPGAFETHCPLMSLPLKFGTELDSIPAPAQFAIPAEMKANWARRTSYEKPKVALVWAGNPTQQDDRTRSLSFRSLLPLTTLNDIEFFSLQVGAAAKELKTAGLAERIHDLSPFLTDYAETASAVACMDLVISVDTSVAHLAGTLGKPVWTLVSFVADWRYLKERNDSPWYPSMRLFRQKALGDWETIIQEIVVTLPTWLASRSFERQ